MRLLTLMENVRNFAGNRVTRAPRALRPVQLTQVITNSYGTHYKTCTRRFSNSNLRTYEPPKAIVNRILDSTDDLLDTARAITNLTSARTTASTQRKRQTSQTGKGGAHDQDPLNHHHQATRKPHHDQQIAPQHGTTRSQPSKRTNSDRARNKVPPAQFIRIHSKPSPTTQRPPSP